MSIDYHRGTSESIASLGDFRPLIQRDSPHGHYSATTGEWDGQLPQTEVLQSTEPDYSDRPGPVIRREWATLVGINFQLSGGERAILQSYAHDCGTPRGCWKSAATLANEPGYNDDFIRDGRQKLIELGVLADLRRYNRAQRVTLNMVVTGGDTGLQDQSNHLKPRVTPCKKELGEKV